MLAKVVEVRTSSDGLVRSCTVGYNQTKATKGRKYRSSWQTLQRSVQRLTLLLPIEEQQEDLVVVDNEVHVAAGDDQERSNGTDDQKLWTRARLLGQDNCGVGEGGQGLRSPALCLPSLPQEELRGKEAPSRIASTCLESVLSPTAVEFIPKGSIVVGTVSDKKSVKNEMKTVDSAEKEKSVDSEAVLKENKVGENFHESTTLSDFPWRGAVSTGENYMDEDKNHTPLSKSDAWSPDSAEALGERMPSNTGRSRELKKEDLSPEVKKKRDGSGRRTS